MDLDVHPLELRGREGMSRASSYENGERLS